MQSFLIQKALLGAQRLNPPKNVRLPIHTTLLHKMLDAISTSANDHYTKNLFRAMFNLAFHAFLRIGEITVRQFDQAESILQYQDCHFRAAGFEITLTHFKGNTSRTPFTILIPNARNLITAQSYPCPRILHAGARLQGPSSEVNRAYPSHALNSLFF